MSTNKKKEKEILKSHLTENVNSIKDAFVENLNDIFGDLSKLSDNPLKLKIMLKSDGISSQTTLTYGRNKRGKCGYWPKEQWVGACLE